MVPELRSLIDTHARPGKLNTTIDGLMLSKVYKAAAPEISLAQPIFVIMAQGAKRFLLGERTLDYERTPTRTSPTRDRAAGRSVAWALTLWKPDWVWRRPGRGAGR
jgi:hypothetical protein